MWNLKNTANTEILQCCLVKKLKRHGNKNDTLCKRTFLVTFPVKKMFFHVYVHNIFLYVHNICYMYITGLLHVDYKTVIMNVNIKIEQTYFFYNIYMLCKVHSHSLLSLVLLLQHELYFCSCQHACLFCIPCLFLL